MTTTQGRRTAGARRRGDLPGRKTPPTFVLVNDYGVRELAGAESAVGADNANGVPVPLSIATTNRPFDTAAQGQFVAERVRALLAEQRAGRPVSGHVFVASTDQRKGAGDVERLKNEGAPFYAAYIPHIDTVIAMANSEDCWAPLMPLLEELGVQAQQISLDGVETQFRGARVFPRLASDFRTAAVKALNEGSTQLLETGTVPGYPTVSAAVTAGLRERTDSMLQEPNEGVTEFVRPVSGVSNHRAFWISDYKLTAAHADQASRTLDAQVVPVSIATGDFIDAGLIAPQLSLNSETKSLYVVDSHKLPRDHGLYATRLPTNKSVIIGPDVENVWRNLQDAGAEIHRVDMRAFENMSLLDIARDLGERDQEEFLQGMESDLPVIGAPLEDVIEHADPFGQGKFNPSSKAQQFFSRLGVGGLIGAAVDRVTHVARRTAGIFGLKTHMLGVAPGSSGWKRLDGSERKFWELVIRDQSAMRGFQQPHDRETGRARSGGRLAFADVSTSANALGLADATVFDDNYRPESGAASRGLTQHLNHQFERSAADAVARPDASVAVT